MPLLAILLPALLPALVDGVRGLFGLIFGGKGATPQNVDDAIRLMEAETKKLQALADLDKPAGEISKWVADLRASFRYLAAGLIIVGSLGVVLANGLGIYVNADVVDTLLQMTSSVFSFMFGDRMYFHLKNGRR